MRFKSRYLLCELVLEDPRWRQNISHGTIVYNVREAVARTHGDFGAAACAVSLSVKYLNVYTGVVLLRCRKDFYQLLWSSLPFITSLDNRGQRIPCFINTLHVGGNSVKVAIDAQIFSYKTKFNTIFGACMLEDEPTDIGQLVNQPIPKIFVHQPGFTTESSDTGTIRTCQKFLIQYNKNQLLQLLKNCTNAAEKEAIRQSLQSCSLQSLEEPEFVFSKSEDNE